MKVCTQLKDYQPDSERPLILALGNFDGLHLGHQKILDAVVERAKRQKGTSAVLTFAEHPQRVIHQSQDPALLTSPQHRLFLFQQMGIEVCFLLHFTLEFSKTDPEEFVRESLVNRLRVREIHLGHNAHFGFNRKGDCDLMRRLSTRLGFNFSEAEAVKIDGEFVSSSSIRKAILDGDLNKAKKFLGRPFSLFASVVRGKGRGKSLGFPTANLKPHSEILPPRGVYSVEVRKRVFHLKTFNESREFDYVLEEPGGWLQGILNYGVRPTFEAGSGEAIPEVFLLDFEGDLYGKTVEVTFHSRIRSEKAFKNQEELILAIKQDAAQARQYFSS